MVTERRGEIKNQKIGSVFRLEAIDWLINEAPSVLGESGFSYSLVGGRCGVIVNTRPFHDKMERALAGVAKARRLNKIWTALDPKDQNVLLAAYSVRRQWPQGFDARFGTLAPVVLFICEDQAELRSVLLSSKEIIKQHKKELLKLEKDADRAVVAAHKAWETERELQALETPCPKWGGL